MVHRALLPVAASGRHEVSNIVLHEGLAMVSTAKTLRKHELGELVGAPIKLYVGDAGSRSTVYHCVLVWHLPCPSSWIHPGQFLYLIEKNLRTDLISDSLDHPFPGEQIPAALMPSISLEIKI